MLNGKEAVKCKRSIFCQKAAHICNLFFFLVLNNMEVEEENKLKNWCDVLITVTKYNIKFGSETTTVQPF